jgi:hypothetical protein
MERGNSEEGQGVMFLIYFPHFCLVLNIGLKSPVFSTCFCFQNSGKAQAAEFRYG